MSQITLKFTSSINYAAFQDADMPPASNYTTFKQDRCLVWNIDGFFGTSEGREYFLDVAKNLSLHFKLPIKELIYTSRHNKNHTAYKLGQFKYIENLRSTKIRFAGLGMATDDPLFDDMRYYAMDLERRCGSSYELINAYGNTLTQDWKKVRMKARNIQNWVETVYALKDYAPKKKSTCTRTINAAAQAQARSDAKYRQFLDYIEISGTAQSISQIAAALGMTWRTVKKYLNRWIENRIEVCRNKAMLFIRSIRGTARQALPVAATGKIKQGIIMGKLKERIKTMSMGDLLELRERISVSDASIKKKEKILNAIRLRTHGVAAALVVDGEIKLGEFS